MSDTNSATPADVLDSLREKAKDSSLAFNPILGVAVLVAALRKRGFECRPAEGYAVVEGRFYFRHVWCVVRDSEGFENRLDPTYGGSADAPAIEYRVAPPQEYGYELVEVTGDAGKKDANPESAKAARAGYEESIRMLMRDPTFPLTAGAADAWREVLAAI